MFKTFIHEFILKIDLHIARVLKIRFEMARFLYNAVLKEALNRSRLIKQSKLLREAKNAGTKNRNKLFRKARSDYKFSDYSLQQFAIVVKNKCAIGKHLDTHTCQKIATRAYLAVDKYMKNIRGRPRFKRKGWISSVESKSNKAGIRFRKNQIFWKGLIMPIILDKKDPYLVQEHALNSKIKYCRLLRKNIKGKELYVVQLVLEGQALIKKKNLSKNAVVSFDIGPSSIAVFSEKKASPQVFCKELDPLIKDLRLVQRKMDRSKRAANPENYKKNGTVKKGRLSWFFSKNYQEYKKICSENYRRLKEYRKRLHGKLANQIIKLGNLVKTEKLSYRAWQKNYGKSIGKRAPSKFLEIVRRKVENTGGVFEEFSTKTTCLSQICHQCNKKKKKKLSQRWHKCCDILAQRDLYSAFLAYHVKDNVLDISRAKKAWPSAHLLLEQAMSGLKKTAIGRIYPASFGLSQSQSGSFVKDKSEINKTKDVVGNAPRALESLFTCY